MLKSLLILFVASILLVGCKKVEGPGGSSKIHGKIQIQRYDAADNLIGDPYDAEEEDVYIIYGASDTFHDDDVKTSFDGSFEFDFLEKGDYQIFVYEDCKTCSSGKSIILKSVTIESKKSEVDLGTITVRKDL